MKNTKIRSGSDKAQFWGECILSQSSIYDPGIKEVNKTGGAPEGAAVVCFMEPRICRPEGRSIFL